MTERTSKLQPSIAVYIALVGGASLATSFSAFAQVEGAGLPVENGEPGLATIPVASTDSVVQPESPANNKSVNRLVEEVVVTAQKREERLLDVPISISAFSADKLEAQGVTTADDLARVTPGMTFTKVAGFSLVYIRGVGTDAFLPGADQSVPQYIDGVNILAGQGVQNSLGRVQRVEVLKGPQGTLFGRNSTGGAINIITPDPEPTFFGDATMEAGNYGTLNEKFYVNIPVIDSLALAVSAFNQHQDEYYKNASGPIFSDAYSRGGQGKIKWSPSDWFSLTLGGQYSETQSTGSLVTENTKPTAILGALIPTDPADRVAHQDVLGGSRVRTYLVSATAVSNFDLFDVKAIVSDQEVKMPFNFYDFDMSPLPLVSFSVPRQYAKQKTAELQILSNSSTPWSDRLEWVAGLYYLKGEGGFGELDLHIAQSGLLSVLPGGRTLGDILNAQLVNAGLPALLAGDTNAVSGGIITSKSESAYLQGTDHITDTIDLTLGIRYQNESRGVKESRFGLLSPIDGSEIDLLRFSPPTVKTTELSPRIALQWKPNDDVNVYTSAARGYQSPTYNAVNFFSSPDEVKAVKVDAYELGLKFRDQDIGLQADSAVFYTKEKNVTSAFVSLTSGGVARFDNAGAAEIKGAEATFTLAPFRDWDAGLAFNGGLTYLDAKYTDYKNGRGWDETTGLSFGKGALLPARDFTGNRITRTPKFTYTFGVNQNIPMDSGWFEFAVDTYYNSGYFFLAQNSPLYKCGSYQLVNASASYFYDAWKLLVTAYAQNVTNETYIDSEFDVDFGRGDHLNQPRTFGLRTKLTF